MIKQTDFFYNLIDFIIAPILILVTSPLFILAVFLVKIDSPGPIFYIQKRYGKNKNIFWIYKFRTMKVNAEDGCPIWGEEADPRSSKIGKFLRVSHIDELPQLFNVLEGEMGLVGPRPERPYFAEKFEASIPDYEERYKVKPGITGLSQINGLRAEGSVEGRTLYDLFYIRNRSILFNLRILLLTPFAKPVRHYKGPETVKNSYFIPLLFSRQKRIRPEALL